MPVALTISQIRNHLLSGEPSEQFLKRLEADSRAGVKQLAKTTRSRLRASQVEQARLEKMFEFERRLRSGGDTLIAGVDEVGRGPLAGPVVAAAVILPESVDLPLLNDSKALKPAQREKLDLLIRETAVCWATGLASPEEIDTINILHASLLAMRRALENLSPSPQRVLVDGKWACNSRFPELTLIKGDSRSGSIAAASIVAKVARDRMMVDLDNDYPGYNLAGNKGYPSPDHLEALARLGPTPIHRTSFHSVAEAGKKSDVGPERKSAAQRKAVLGTARWAPGRIRCSRPSGESRIPDSRATLPGRRG